MKISSNFVIVFLLAFLVVIIGNIAALSLNFYQSWMGYLLGALFVVLFFLIFRKHKVGFIRILAWVLPIIFILVVLYINFLPFGFQKDYTITIAQDGSVLSSSSQVWLQDLKENKITNLTDVYDYGQINVVIKPRAVLGNATVNVSIINSNISNVYLAKTSFDVHKNKWDYSWNFTKKMPSSLDGTVKYDKDEGCVYFNGSLNQTLSYYKSEDMFENGSFIVYAEWKPEDVNGTNQQIMGHYNWELWQSNDSVRFMVGRLDNKNGTLPSISYPVNASFFNKSHNALAVYFADKKKGLGYIELFVDGNFLGRKTISNQTIWADYNGERSLTFGKSGHGVSTYYTGCVYQTGFDYGKVSYVKNDSFNSNSNSIQIPILGDGRPQEIKISVKK